MNEHQRRLWQGMISRIEQYRIDRTGYSELVGELEGALDAGEFHDKALISGWYDRWTHLETLNATRGDAVRYEDAAKALEEMLRFLHEHTETGAAE